LNVTAIESSASPIYGSPGYFYSEFDGFFVCGWRR
jgi:hypothetical protein